IDADVVAELAAQKFVHRHLQRLALEIPQGNLDASQSRDEGSGKTALEHQASPDLFEDGIDGKRIAADQLLSEFALNDGDGLVAAMDAFTKAGDAGVGFDAHPKMHAMADRGCRLDCRYLHELPP